jgi:DtxR family transcriptional regulator, Mn-dependent transcriptional regulator
MTAYTASVEDCLKAVYELERSGDAAVSTTDLANRLGVAPPSVTGMMRRLADSGLIEYEPYHGARLTNEGQRVALRTLRRHRVLETYLSRALGIPWDRVHEEAERLEHAASDELIDRMATVLGHPTVDPHGAPIPTAEGAIDERVLTPLAELSPGDRARIVCVNDEDPERLRYLAELGLVPGVVVTLVSRQPFGGPLSFRYAGAVRDIGPALGEVIFAEPL